MAPLKIDIEDLTRQLAEAQNASNFAHFSNLLGTHSGTIWHSPWALIKKARFLDVLFVYYDKFRSVEKVTSGVRSRTKA